MANKDIVREAEVTGDEKRDNRSKGVRGDLVSAIMGDITRWRAQRDNDFQALWDEFYAKWRGFWTSQQKNYKTERSKLIAPLTSMSIDLTSAEIMEAVLGREYFVDLPDNKGDEDPTDMEQSREFLCEDLKNEGFIDEFAQTVINGCLYGTGIMKIEVTTKKIKKPYRTQDGRLVASQSEKVVIRPRAIDPGAFVPDPGAKNIDEMKGCAHEYLMPLHTVKERQQTGFYYRNETVGTYNKPLMDVGRGDTEGGNTQDKGDVVFITEYYGKVPTRDFLRVMSMQNGVGELPAEVLAGVPADDTTEVIATIANEGTLLRVIETPCVTGERLIVAYQHETVPNRFWGRGVAEKGKSVQRAMDAEMRARIDALAWSNMPMFAGDLTRMPPNSNLSAWPGKFWGLRGNPNDVIREFKIQGVDPNTFQHIQDLERMGQQATGALDTPGLRAGVRDETATGSAIAASSFIKRSKRTMYNIEQFLTLLVRRVLYLKMDFEPNKYKADYEFNVRGTAGMMAREIEAQNMVSILSVIGPDSPASIPLLRAIVEHSSSPIRLEVSQALRAMAEKQPTPEEQAAQSAMLQRPVLENQELQAKVMKLMADAGYKDAQEDDIRADIGRQDESQAADNIRALNDLRETDNQSTQISISARKQLLEEAKFRRGDDDPAKQPKSSSK
jgi:hypothetical protein